MRLQSYSICCSDIQLIVNLNNLQEISKLTIYIHVGIRLSRSAVHAPVAEDSFITLLPQYNAEELLKVESYWMCLLEKRKYRVLGYVVHITVDPRF